LHFGDGVVSGSEDRDSGVGLFADCEVVGVGVVLRFAVLRTLPVLDGMGRRRLVGGHIVNREGPGASGFLGDRTV